MNKILVLLFLIFTQIAFLHSQEVPVKKTQKAFAQIDFMSISMPKAEIQNEANMGFTGIHYNLNLNDWSYAGIGLYGSVTGQRGGFFTLGVNAGVLLHITKNLYLDTGFHFGGGGGAAAPDGGGAFILPHINLRYDFKHFAISSGWSFIDFFDGGLIETQQWNVALQIPLSFEYTFHHEKETELSIGDFSLRNWQQKAKKIAFLFHLNNLNVVKKTTATSNDHLAGRTIRLAGFEFDAYQTKNWFVFVKVDGAYDGIQAGYMDVFLGGGYHLSMNKNRTNIIAKFGIGAGGGGGVDTKGGFLLYPDISIEQQLFKDLYISLNKGYLRSPDRDFFTSSFGIGLKHYVNANGSITDKNEFATGKFKGFEVSMGQDLYYDAKRGSNPTENLHQISMQINFNLNDNLYIAGQTSFANFGNAGAYAEGIVGMGIKIQPLSTQRITLFTQILTGAAGGGDISTGQGLIFKPSAGIEFALNNTLSLQMAGGLVKALGGKLNSPFLNAGLKYRFSFLKLK